MFQCILLKKRTKEKPPEITQFAKFTLENNCRAVQKKKQGARMTSERESNEREKVLNHEQA